MPILNYPRSAAEVVATLVELFEHQGERDLAEIIRAAQARIEHTDSDDWNGGSEYFTLFLELPVRQFAPIEPRLEDVEKAIQTKLSRIFRAGGGLVLSRAQITAAPSEARSISRRTAASEGEVTHIWDADFLRLFLSHVSAHKIPAANLKRELRSLGVSVFVAHEDIEPSLEWEQEIEKALGSMDALAAVLTPDFHASKWTDQEVGIALGRGILIIPIRVGALPYGFIGKQQALDGDFDGLEELASQVVDVLLRRRETSEKMRDALVVALERAPSFAASRLASRKIVTAEGFTSEQFDRIESACALNRQVKESTGVESRLQRFLDKHRPKPNQHIPPQTDDVPF